VLAGYGLGVLAWARGADVELRERYFNVEVERIAERSTVVVRTSSARAMF